MSFFISGNTSNNHAPNHIFFYLSDIYINKPILYYIKINLDNTVYLFI